MALLPRFDPGALPPGWWLALGATDAERERSALEAALCAAIGTTRGVTVPSARVGILRVLRALGARPGDEVVVGAFNYAPLIERMRLAGLVVVPADVDPHTLFLDPASVRSRITRRTRALLVTHVFGRACPVAEVASAAHGLPLIEDCAQAIGARTATGAVGSLGSAGVVSFGPTKPVPSVGGGAVVTSDPLVAARVRALREPPPIGASTLRQLRAGVFAAATRLGAPARLGRLIPAGWLVDAPGALRLRRPWHEAELTAFEARSRKD
jgi:hypothetical protein